MNVIVLGGGLIGAPMAFDLASDKRFNVTVCDINKDTLQKISERCPSILTISKNLSNPNNVKSLVKKYDFVLNAVPGFMGFQTAKAIIETKKDCVCISFYEEDPFLLDKIAKEHDVTMVMDCGIYPGMGSVLIMDQVLKLDSVQSVITYVGGLPVIREWPSEYKSVFSPTDVIEEYIRPARFVENGIDVVRPALSDPEYIFFPKIGTLEAFNTDGLRTLSKTINAPNLKEKTLRYPGHIEKITVLKALGFFEKEHFIKIKGVSLSPLEVTEKILFPNWKLKQGEADITIFKSIIEGDKNGKKVRYIIELFDTYCPETDIISMARTTGYTATITLRMIAERLYSYKGISPPEFLGKKPECVKYLLKELRKRGVIWNIIKEQ
jgi:saccharopine dehydrogenase-like NADP-dependent oxidoreductase